MKKRLILLVGATHGNENSGVQMFLENKIFLENLGEKNGIDFKFILGNPQGFLENVRYIDQDLNRSFQKDILNSSNINIETLRAKEIAKTLEILSESYEEKYILEFHSVSTGDAQINVINTSSRESKELLLEISPIPFVFIFQEKFVPGTLVAYANSLGFMGGVLECGNHQSENAKKVALLHVLNLLKHLKIDNLDSDILELNKFINFEKPHRVYETISIIDPKSNFSFVGEVYSEKSIAKGEVYGKNKQGDVVAPEDCFIVMPSKNIKESDFDAGWLCKRVVL